MKKQKSPPKMPKIGPMTTDGYIVEWSMELEALRPAEAVEMAVKALLNGIAPFFNVSHSASGRFIEQFKVNLTAIKAEAAVEIINHRGVDQ